MITRLQAWLGMLVRFLARNIEWVTISFALGLIIWLLAALDQNPVQQREFSEGVRIEFVEDDDVIRSTTSAALLNSRRVRVTLRAPRATWEAINSEDIRITADLTNLAPGTHIVELHGEIINGDLQGRVISLSPAQVTVELVEVGERLVQVVPEIANPPARDYSASTPTCDPNQITVRGPAPEIDRVASAVVRLDLATVTQSTTQAGTVILFNTNNRVITNLTVQPETVLCQVEISRREDRDLVVVVPSVIGQVPEGYSLSDEYLLDPTEIEVSGDEAAIAAMQGVVITEPIDVTGQTETFSRVVAVQLPDGVRLVPTTQRVTVTITIIEDAITRNFNNVPVQVLNLDLPLDITLTPSLVTVAVTGPRSVVSDITVDDLSITADLSGLTEGTHENIPLTVNFLRESLQNEDDIAVVIQPATISATITLEPTPTPTPIGLIGKRLE